MDDGVEDLDGRVSMRCPGPEVHEPAGLRDAVHRQDELDDILGVLTRAIPGERRALTEIQRQWRSKRIRVVVLGEAKRGKSSLINALVGRAVLPTGVVPVTSISTVVRPGSRDAVEAIFDSGDRVTIDLDGLADYVTEQQNPGNCRGVRSVAVTLTGVDWPDTVAFIDTPGTGSVDELHDAASSTAAGSMDVALAVVSADPPVSAREREQIAVAAAISAATFIVVTKSDLVTPSELETVIEYTRGIAQRATGRAIEVIAVSAKDPTTDSHPGLLRIRSAIASIATDPAQRTLLRSLQGRTRRLIATEQDDVELQVAVGQLNAEEAADRAQKFAHALHETRIESHASAELISAGIRSLNNRLDESVAMVTAELTDQLRQVAEGFVGSLGDDHDAMTVAFDEMTRLATKAAEAWRQLSAEQTKRDLEEVGRRATAHTETTLNGVRGVAQDLFGIQLHLTPAPISLPEDARFFYLQGSLTDAATAIAGMVRDRLPRRVRRRSVTSHLRETAATLADRQLGRARGDLRLRVRDVERLLVEQTEENLGAVLDRLEGAATAASDLVQGEAARADRLRPLEERRVLLADARRRLTELSGAI